MRTIEQVLELKERYDELVEELYKQLHEGKITQKECFSNKERGNLLHELHEDKIFKCESCGQYVAYGDLETWCCDFDEQEYLCSLCYEDEMGEDL